MFTEIFNDLLDENNLNRKQFAEKSGIPYTTVIGWTKLNRLPDYTALIKIADFFGCSVDFLVNRQNEYDPRPSNISLSEQSLLKNFRKLNSENRELLCKLSKNLVKCQKNGN